MSGRCVGIDVYRLPPAVEHATAGRTARAASAGGEADNGRDLIDVMYRCRPDVLLLDYKMPHVTNFTVLLKDTRTQHPLCQVIVLSGFASADIATRAAEAGAHGYVLKSTRLNAVA